MSIHVAVGEEKKGPFSEEEIRAKVKTGEIKPDTMAWKSGMDDWVSLQEIVSDLPAAEMPPDVPMKKKEPSGPLYAIVERFWDGFMGKLDGLLSERVFNAVSKALTTVAFYALPVGAALCVLGGILAAVKADSLAMLMVLGLGYAVLISILTYIP